VKLRFASWIIIGVSLFFLVARELGMYFYPIQTVVIRNRILSTVGLEKRLELPQKLQGRSITQDQPVTQYPTLTRFQFNRYLKSRHLYSFSGEKLRFVDKQFWLIRTPLVREGEISNPKLTFYCKDGSMVECNALKAVMDPKTHDLEMAESVRCEMSGSLIRVSSAALDSGAGELEIRRFLKPRLVLR
jgi:hypothetical protein